MNKKIEWKLLNLGSNITDNMLCAFIFLKEWKERFWNNTFFKILHVSMFNSIANTRLSQTQKQQDTRIFKGHEQSMTKKRA
jgi:acyl-homoserine lactone acylase PvdQ